MHVYVGGFISVFGKKHCSLKIFFVCNCMTLYSVCALENKALRWEKRKFYELCLVCISTKQCSFVDIQPVLQVLENN